MIMAADIDVARDQLARTEAEDPPPLPLLEGVRLVKIYKLGSLTEASLQPIL